MILQKFFTDTLMSRYIKSMLSQTPIPNIPCVVDNDYIVKDCFYIYKTNVIKCTTSGNLSSGGDYDIISLVDESDIKLFSTYESLTNRYDSQTHYMLGRYLRYLKATKNLNLMNYYNCQNENYVSDVILTRDSSASNKVVVNRSTTNNKKTVAVPIQFDKTYTIAIESSTEVMMCPVMRSPYGLLYSYDEGTTSGNAQDTFLTAINAWFQRSSIIKNNMVFRKPVNFKLSLSDLGQDDFVDDNEIDSLKKFCVQRYNCFYLIIQVDTENKSSIVVLEDCPETGIYCDSDSVRSEGSYVMNLSLLNNNYYAPVAFSTRLIEYLLGNVIHSDEWYAKNIEKVQSSLRGLFSDYDDTFDLRYSKHSTMGIFDDRIKSHVNKLVTDYAKTKILYDQDGNINVDVEKLLISNGGDY